MDLKEKIVDDFKKYITGVYLLQQDFIDDIESGLKAVIEPYSINYKTEILKVEQPVKNVPVPVQEQQEEEQQEEEQEEEQEQQQEEEQENNSNHSSVHEQENTVVPQSVINTFNNQDEKVKKKKVGRKPGSKNKEKDENKTPRKKKDLTGYTVYVQENSQRVIKENSGKKLSQQERMSILSKEWEATKEDPEKYKYYMNLTEEKNRERNENQ